MFIDTHAHLNFKAFDNDRSEVIKRSLEQDVWMINVSSNYKTSKLAVEIAQCYERGVFASVGLHPINCVIDLSQADEDRLEELDIEKYRKLAKEKGVVAVGEIGLDYWNEPKGKGKAKIFKEKQKEVFLVQLDLAKELGLPVILHCRKAHNEIIEIMCNFYAYAQKLHINGVVHCFTGNRGQAQKYLDMGLYLGFNGIIFKMDLDEVMKKIPLGKILIETDCPFLTPPALGGQRNEPVNVKYVAQRIAEIRNEPLEEIVRVTTENAKKLFQI
ncbi:hydrolase TatD [bacterium (Candidatus Gribaldobacteria) CG08_land_8_20_14_0_20_39_15]|uniref:Hydrolase TatD n=1 Tax=bacterium (Candidatus Gribaldobacteria) CG08_land_8_20_14_0_20_39_15 TaxID=2014273 RepID=A0A2M6XUL0_9BACT|nr:MAG: hydrolase TatD [bacterium (Candidatus Gribaldobacteria) CG08_land_8_20_14_0_20_39_15]